MTARAQVVALVKDGARVERAGAGDEVVILTNQTPFYGESGGQMGDTGKISSRQGLARPMLRTRRSRSAGSTPIMRVIRDGRGRGRRRRPARRSMPSAATQVRANHSATHLLHAALRKRLGGHVTQKGSLVAPDYFRFDFSHPKPLTREEIEAVEAEVNRHIRENEPVGTRLMSPDEAIAAGAMALFGEKYGDEVRVLSMGRRATRRAIRSSCAAAPTSTRSATSSCSRSSRESAVAAGVRRIEALTGEAARQLADRPRGPAQGSRRRAQGRRPRRCPARVASLLDERRRLERELAEAKKALALGGGGKAEAAGPEQVGGHGFIGQVLEGLDPKGAARPGRRGQAARRLGRRRAGRGQ